jgi:hypothetical protein
VSVINQGNITDRRDYVERSVTAVEQDLVALEGRVADLEAAVVPRAQLIGYYQATWDPPNIAANSNINQGATITFADGYSALLETDVFDVSHFGVQANPNLTMYATKDENLNTLARVYVKNHSGSGINPASATLTILVYRLVLA